MFNPNHCLFSLQSNGVSFHPNQQSFQQDNHLQFFKFVGRVIGKAIFEGMYLECHFSKPFYKMILGEDLAFEDLEDMDNAYYKNLKWSLENDVTNCEFYFCVDKDQIGRVEEVDLKPGGKDIKVTNETKEEYVELLAYYQMFN